MTNFMEQPHYVLFFIGVVMLHVIVIYFCVVAIRRLRLAKQKQKRWERTAPNAALYRLSTDMTVRQLHDYPTMPPTAQFSTMRSVESGAMWPRTPPPSYTPRQATFTDRPLSRESTLSSSSIMTEYATPATSPITPLSAAVSPTADRAIAGLPPSTPK
ncbi:hypothetical protein THASP1DRAFT_27452 [Thamnocephalis sphaerospora]|uniref:Uncharacterized protein n=1 Tax=Thamnocephalis sphaerospora TaxID=78915 RepID=A0A4P9XXI3_9FUNG|nr:hypothetical protein THASP1DRAFT_27452 [Thamnocephalis sphaerospora]|eukprot:RKP10742.1 hypothetical protein THASP1DRAFT_27452 [Thamnocephalis sphaerospora]